VISSKSRPIIAVLSIVAAASLLLSACSGVAPSGANATTGGSAGTSGKEQVTLTYWDWWVTQSPTIDSEIELFQQQYPNIKIKKATQVVDKYPELLQLSYKGGNAPDVFLIPEKPNFVDQVKQGWFLPLNKWATTEWQSQYPEASFAEGSNVVDGKIYSAPYEGAAPWLQLYVNTKVFKDAGLVDGSGNVVLPKNWDDVRADAKTISKSSGGKVYGFGFGDKQKFSLPWQMMMVQNSGAPGGTSGLDTRTGLSTWASNPAYAQWINFFMGMKDDGSIVPNAMSMDDEMARAAFADGKFGMIVGGVWNQAGWAKTNPDFKDYTLTQLPYGGEAQSSYFYRTPGGYGWAVSAQTKHPEEAWLWFNWLNSKPASERWVKAGQGVRVYPDVNEPDYAPTPQFAEFLKLAQTDVRLAPAPGQQHPAMNDVKTQPTKPDIQDILEGVYTGQITDVKSALKDLESRENAQLQLAIKDAQSRGVKVDAGWWKVADWDITRDYTGGIQTAQN
jgi:ABC-type glycerol-3-phosphate transport system substrate-binding protein